MTNNVSPEPRQNRMQLYLPWLFRSTFILAIGVLSWLGLTEDPPSIGLGWDKLNHIAAFAVLAGLAWFSDLVPNKPQYFGFLIVFVYAVFTTYDVRAAIRNLFPTEFDLMYQSYQRLSDLFSESYRRHLDL